MGTLAGIYVFVALIAIVIGILWICLPFAVFGTKPILHQIDSRLAVIAKQNAEILAALHDARPAQSSGTPRTPAAA